MTTAWIIFSVCILTLLALDLFVFHKNAHVVAFKEAAIWSAVWIGVALVFNVYVYYLMGREAAINFLTGYLIEKSLSVDNLFVFILIFNYFQTPSTSLHKVLFWGILGAIVTRALFILLGLSLVQAFHPIIYLFGLFLIFTGIKLGFQKDKEIHLEKNWMLRFVKRLLPMTQEYTVDHFWIRKGGRVLFTPLFLVLLVIESTDIIFAIDSIPAILAITYDPFIVFTSNIFAVLGLRSLFFLLSGSLQLFRFLHYGISTILVFVGFKMLTSSLWPIPPFVALGVIAIILVVTILASILIKKNPDKEN